MLIINSGGFGLFRSASPLPLGEASGYSCYLAYALYVARLSFYLCTCCLMRLPLMSRSSLLICVFLSQEGLNLRPHFQIAWLVFICATWFLFARLAVYLRGWVLIC
jgi:hypothetical protein